MSCRYIATVLSDAILCCSFTTLFAVAPLPRVGFADKGFGYFGLDVFLLHLMLVRSFNDVYLKLALALH